MPRKKKPAPDQPPTLAAEPRPAPEPSKPIIALRRRPELSGAPHELTEEGIALVERLAGEGATRAQVAGALKIDRSTLREIMKRQPAADEAYERGKAADELLIANKLREQALGGNLTAQIFYLKGRHGWREGAEREPASVQVGVQIIQLPAAAKSDAEFYQRFPPPELAPSKGDDE